MQEKYNVGIYCRLSRDDERTGESVSIENQKIMLSRYVQEQGWNLYAAYCDDGVSGTTFDRPMFNQMIADARAGKINLILCKDLSRLGRDYIEAGRYSVRKRRFLHLWCVKFLKREAVLKNPTFSRFTHCKSVFSFALNNFISAFFCLYLFCLHKV